MYCVYIYNYVYIYMSLYIDIDIDIYIYTIYINSKCTADHFQFRDSAHHFLRHQDQCASPLQPRVAGRPAGVAGG